MPTLYDTFYGAAPATTNQPPSCSQDAGVAKPKSDSGSPAKTDDPTTVLERLAAVDAEMAGLPTQQNLLDRLSAIGWEIKDIQARNTRRRAELYLLKGMEHSGFTLNDKRNRLNLINNILRADRRIADLKQEQARINEDMKTLGSRRQKLLAESEKLRLEIGRAVVFICKMIRFLLGPQIHGKMQKAEAEEVARRKELEELRAAKQRAIKQAGRVARRAAHRAKEAAEKADKQRRLAALRPQKTVAPPKNDKKPAKPGKGNGKPKKK